jgi:hypothetical protein
MLMKIPILWFIYIKTWGLEIILKNYVVPQYNNQPEKFFYPQPYCVASAKDRYTRSAIISSLYAQIAQPGRALR